MAIGKVEDLSKDMVDMRKALKDLERRFDDKLFELESKIMLDVKGVVITKTTLDKFTSTLPDLGEADEVPF